ncbi:hypothetical protein [Nostoc sp.]|uniref:hypothetical protein n=1 Tax=Nostoc sp. TaxID=1180 RepID=UPI002FFB6B20
MRRGDAHRTTDSVRAASRREAVASQTLRTVANATLPLRREPPQGTGCPMPNTHD